jgi:hypothetical protein
VTTKVSFVAVVVVVVVVCAVGRQGDKAVRVGNYATSLSKNSHRLRFPYVNKLCILLFFITIFPLIIQTFSL